MAIENLLTRPLKIEIERNTGSFKELVKTPFFITINGKRLENVKRFYVDLDKDKLVVTRQYRDSESIVNEIKPWTYGVEYEDYPDEEND